MTKPQVAMAILGAALGTLPMAAAAQEPADRITLFHGPWPEFEMQIPPPGAENLMILRAEDGFETRLVKGAPYQAEAVTEVTQTLADGNRIVRKTTAAIARDGEGRTRREHALAAVGPALAKAGANAVFIHDPVAGTSFVLLPDERVARRLPRPPALAGGAGDPADGLKAKLRRIRPAPGEEGARPAKPEQQSLGTRTIEGVEASGTRTTITIPAGEIGNQQPITIVDERWYSPELKVMVSSLHSDPRFGETSYRLTNITRGEPDRALFEVPADYTVKEAPSPRLFQKRLPEPDL